MKTFVYHLNDIQKIVSELWPIFKAHKVLALHGALGAGKTTFTVALCRFLGVEERPDSPTFSIINQYTFGDGQGQQQIIYHSDWYRIKSEEEALHAGIEDMLKDDYALCIVEWPEHAAGLLPENTLHLYFEVEGEAERKIIVSGKKII